MTLSDAIFSINGCFITIDGWCADVSSKLTLLQAGLCNVRAVDPAQAEKADELLCSPYADTDVLACNDPRLVELAARHWQWIQGDDIRKITASFHTDAVAAAASLQKHLSKLP